MASTDEEVRKMNLIDILLEDNEECEEPPEYAIQLWSEEQIRQYFDNGGVLEGLPTPGDTTAPVSAAPPVKDKEQLKSEYPAVSSEEFGKWFPGLKRSKTECPNPKMRLVCFTNAGNEENVFTNAGVGARKVAGLLDWCVANQVEVLAVQLPGRGMRRQDPFITTAQAVAKETLRVIGSQLIDVPYCMIAHSVGTWNSFEFLSLARAEGFPMPLKVFFSAFPSPDIPEAERPWKRNAPMADPAFMDEARGWNVNEVVFGDQMWPQYKDLMRADFKLFDEYEYGHAAAAPFAFPITTFFASDDLKVKEHMVKGWHKFTSSEFEVNEIRGHHLYVMGLDAQKPAKEHWYGVITGQLTQLMTEAKLSSLSLSTA